VFGALLAPPAAYNDLTIKSCNPDMIAHLKACSSLRLLCLLEKKSQQELQHIRLAVPQLTSVRVREGFADFE
jgi:hypothetical protein